MSLNLSPNPNTTNNYQYADRKPTRNVVVVIITVVVLLLVIVVAMVLSKPDKLTQSALTAARKVTPNAKVRDVKAADGFAVAVVSDPTARGELKTGVLTYFKLNDDESMTQIASGNTPLPISLLELGISLPTQASLNGSSIDDVLQNLPNDCDFSENDSVGYEDSIGYAGFGGSFDPDGWQIDPSSLSNIKQVLNSAIHSRYSGAVSENGVVCVLATNNNSDVTTDKITYNSTFSLELNFVDNKGQVSKHAFTFSLGPNNIKKYTLDGRNLPITSD